MSKLNLQENLFIGVQELKAFQEFSMNYYKIFGLMTKNFGLVENADSYNLSNIENQDRTSFKLSSPNALQLQFYSPSYAFAYPCNLITWDKNRIITLPDSYKGKNYWVKIKYAEDSIEEGTLQIDGNGNITGIGTEFISKLRGEPGFPSRIQLYTFNGVTFDKKESYIVESVNSDTSISVYSELGTIGDISLTYYYSVIGTFPEGSLLEENQRYSFVYDSCEVSFIEETTFNEIPDEYIMKRSNTEFYVARISVGEEGLISIQDKRFIFEEEEIYSKWWSFK